MYVHCELVVQEKVNLDMNRTLELHAALSEM